MVRTMAITFQHIGKCKSLQMGKINKDSIYEMNAQKFDQVKEENDLGALSDDELKCYKQTAVKTAIRILGAVKKTLPL